MPTNEQETKAFMTAYSGLKTAAKALESMSHEAEPDLDKMLTQVKLARRYYDQCNEVIENIKSQVESIFGGSVATDNDDDFGATSNERAQKLENKKTTSGEVLHKQPRSDMDDEIPF
jgi:hypothetical protein